MAITKLIKTIKPKKRLWLFLALFLLVGILIWNIVPKSYHKEYNVSDIHVIESYDKDLKTYSFTFEQGSNAYAIAKVKPYSAKRILIHDILTLEDEGITCIKPLSNYINIEPLCIKDGKQLAYQLTSILFPENWHVSSTNYSMNQKNYEQVTIHNTLNHEYYIWNYKGFIHINNQKEEIISLFQNDIYHPKLITKVNHYLFIPDYTSDYYFEKVYVLDLHTGTYKEWNLKTAIYFDGYVAGTVGNEIYLVDKHEEIEWKLDVKKQTAEKIGTKNKQGKIYLNGWQDIRVSKLINENKIFEGLNSITYQSSDGFYETFFDHNILVRMSAPTSIISNQNDLVFYLDKDTLYQYSNETGEVPLLTYFEWNFNYDGMIFVYP